MKAMRNVFPMDSAPRDGMPIIVIAHGGELERVWWADGFWTSLLGESDQDYIGWMPDPMIQYPAGVIPKTESERLLDEAATHLFGMLEAYRILCDDLGKPYYESTSSKYAAARAFLAKLEGRS